MLITAAFIGTLVRANASTIGNDAVSATVDQAGKLLSFSVNGSTHEFENVSYKSVVWGDVLPFSTSTKSIDSMQLFLFGVRLLLLQCITLVLASMPKIRCV